MSGQVKRKFEEVTENPAMPILKRSKKTRQTNVTFGQVTTFSFPRCQGFTGVPQKGGCTLGMMPHHSDQQTYSVTEYDEKLVSRRRKIILNGLKQVKRQGHLPELTKKERRQCRSADQLKSIPQSAVNRKARNWEKRLIPRKFTPEGRYALLKAAGVEHIDVEEEMQLQNLRISRQNRGCDCKGVCDPATCSCSLAGIKCHVKRTTLICGCTEDSCGNTQGRIQSNPKRVLAHRWRTLLRLESEKEEEDAAEDTRRSLQPPWTNTDFHWVF
ncbi:cysteine/serine-rich nuclear protein 2-like [Thalassophryne amazonica]|uniref:cysteine/serine-rich nuclear protein 2-like n=1 Tax=Thalassophryne amazonica TaxID=390379 RepID=UPI00147232C2|nr:cysteine/serine-rich nuclear protein 2-like [Thalassophryne amazonica]